MPSDDASTGDCFEDPKRDPVAGHDDVAQHREPEEGDDARGNVYAVLGEYDAQKCRGDYSAESTGSTRARLEDRQDVGQEQHKEERRHRQRPAAETETWDTRDDPDDQRRDGRGDELDDEVGLAELGDDAGRIRTRGKHRRLSESELTGVSQSQVSPLTTSARMSVSCSWRTTA